MTLLYLPDRSTAAIHGRTLRYEILAYLRSVTIRTAARSCMHALDKGATVSGHSDGSVSIEGVKRCASPWACPVCSVTIAERRAGEIDEMVTSWRGLGGTVLFLTATVQHSAGTPLSDILDAVQDAWSYTWNGARKRTDWFAGNIRSIEITHGRNGWHPHVHAAVFLEPGCSPHSIEAPIGKTSKARTLPQRWQKRLRELGFDSDVTSSARRGWDVRPVHDANGLGSYLSKVQGGWGIGLEIAAASKKKARAVKSRTPFDLLKDAMGGSAFALSMWRFYEDATKGRRSIVVSPGLAARCGVAVVSEPVAAIGEVEAETTVKVHVPAKAWRDMLDTGESALFLADIARAGMDGVRAWRWPPGWLMWQPKQQQTPDVVA